MRTAGLERRRRVRPAGKHDCWFAVLTFGDPNSLTNARGRLLNDRPHMLRVMGSVDVPWIGLVVAGNAQYQREAVGGHGVDFAVAARGPARPD
jgi:hypothetical protein